MCTTQGELFTKSDITAVLLLTALLLVAGAVSIYQKSTEVLPPEVLVRQIESGVALSSDFHPFRAEVTAEMLTVHKININTAPSDSLTLLPGIGPHLADRIIAYRNEGGRFSRVDDLLFVRGIGPARLNAVRDMITTGAE